MTLLFVLKLLTGLPFRSCRFTYESKLVFKMKLFQREERFQPFCGLNSQTVVPKLIIIFQIGSMKGGLVFFSIAMVQIWETFMADKKHNPVDYYIRAACWTGYFIHIIANDFLALMFWNACKKKSPRSIRIWLIVTSFFMCFSIIIGAVDALHLKHNWKRDISPQAFAMMMGYVFMQCYFLYVVYYFMKDMELDLQMSSDMRDLTDKEIAEFEEGLPIFSHLEEKLVENLMEEVKYRRYRKEEFEIKDDKLHLELHVPLGSGDYGKVYKAKWELKDGSTRIVAAKTVDPEKTDVVCFKALLMELKVMTYLEMHPNVLACLGACTEGIRKKKLLIITEFCSFGNLLNFLRAHRGTFRYTGGGRGNDGYDIPLEMETITTLDLLRWTKEIASGMEYLSRMKVLHGDLAARNVLLTEDKTAKVSDFGLARQLYNYSVYVKKQAAPLPWRYLALESLTDMNFSAKSDCWSYAITLWEIFTLGEVPYPGYNFSLEFVHELKGGLRPMRPGLYIPQIWTLMESCWQLDPKGRPTFTQILEVLDLIQSVP